MHIMGRGFTTGLVAAAYGLGTFFTGFPIDSMIKSSGYALRLVVWGIVQGVVGVAPALGLQVPPEGYRPTGFDPDFVRTELPIQAQLLPKDVVSQFDCCGAELKQAVDVGVENSLPFVDWAVHNVGVQPRHACAAHQDVDMARSGLGALGCPPDLLRLRDVDVFRAGFGSELGLRHVELGLVDVPQCELSTLGDDAAGDGEADARSAARDERGHAVEPVFAATFGFFLQPTFANGVRLGRKGAPIWLLRQGLCRVRRDTVAPSLPLFARAQVSTRVGQSGMRPPGRSLEQLHFLGHQQRAEL